MADRYLDRPVSYALRLARLRAGFATAEAAALHCGWPVARYRAHEAGTRKPDAADIDSYSRRFGVSHRSISDPDVRDVAVGFDKLRERDKLAATRLRCARIIRGHSSATRAAAAIRIKTPTYLKHENGENRFSQEIAEVYGRAFRVRADWLLEGELPSGLGLDIDRNIKAALRRPEAYVGKAEQTGEIALSDDLTDLPQGRPPSRKLKIPVYLWTTIEASGGELSRATPFGISSLPMLPREVGVTGLYFVIEDGVKRPHAMSRRLLVGQQNGRGDQLHMIGSKMTIVRERERCAEQTFVGTIIGQFGPIV